MKANEPGGRSQRFTIDREKNLVMRIEWLEPENGATDLGSGALFLESLP